ISFEVIRTLNAFHPDIILTLAQSSDPTQNPLLGIAKFATATNQNLKYLGIAMLCQVLPAAWSDTWWNDQLLSGVVEALDSRDKTIQRKALDLLYRMLTRENSENIIERLVHAFYQELEETPQTNASVGPSDYTAELTIDVVVNRDPSSIRTTPSASTILKSAYSLHRLRPGFSHQEKLLAQILDASEHYARSDEWYVNLIFDLLERAGKVITICDVEKVMRVFEKDSSSSVFDVAHLRQLAVQKAVDVLTQRDYRLENRSLGYFTLWVIGEYAQVSKDYNSTSILTILSRCLAANHGKSHSYPLFVSWTLTALTKLVLEGDPHPVPEEITVLVRSIVLEGCTAQAAYPISMTMDVHQRAQEFLLIAL
ncbi:hypothetical protein BGZ94_000065, partial [Podila epigama]